MISILINILTVVLLLVAVLLGAVVLMQRAKSDAGGLSGMGGGMMESAFGPDSDNILVRTTVRVTVLFFLLSFLIYLGYIYQRTHGAGHSGGALPNISVPAAPPPAAPATAAAPAVSVPVAPASNAAKTTTPGPAPAKTP